MPHTDIHSAVRVTKFGFVATAKCVSVNGSPNEIYSRSILANCFNLLSGQYWKILPSGKEIAARVRIPSDADQRSEVMAIAIPN
jgi:hypothetical protein